MNLLTSQKVSMHEKYERIKKKHESQVDIIITNDRGPQDRQFSNQHPT